MSNRFSQFTFVEGQVLLDAVACYQHSVKVTDDPLVKEMYLASGRLYFELEQALNPTSCIDRSSSEPVCLVCHLSGDQCGCEPNGIFDPADMIDEDDIPW